MSDVDKTCIENLKSLLGEDYSEIVANFIRNTQNYIDAIGTAARDGDRTAVAANAHSLTSSAGQFGLSEVQRLAKTIEKNKATDDDALSQQYKDLQAAHIRALEFMRANGLDR